MSKSANYKKNASRLRNDLHNRNSPATSNRTGTSTTKDTPDETRPPSGLKGRDIGMWYAQRSKQKKDQELVDGGVERQTKMVNEL